MRQVIEREGFVPPKIATGLDIGEGKGPLVLLVRRADGRIILQELFRGRGDHGPAAKKVVLTETPVEEELVEEESVEEGPVEQPAEPAKQPKPLAKERPAKGLAPAAPGPATPASLVIWRRGERLEFGAKAGEPVFRGKAVDPAALRPFLKRQFDARKGRPGQRQLFLQVGAETPMDDVLAAWAVGREVGFEAPLLGGLVMRGPRRLPQQAADAIAGLAEQFEWPVRHYGEGLPGGPQPICDGEVVILLDGPTPFRVVEPLLHAFMRAGIWQIGFIGQRDPATRFKIRTSLPVDAGLLK